MMTHSLPGKKEPQATPLKTISPSTTMDHLPFDERKLHLKDKVIIFIGAGSSPEKRSIYETVKNLGVRAVILDGAGSWASGMLSDGTIAGYFPVAFDADVEVTIQNMLGAVTSIRASIGDPAAVCTFFEIAVPIATQLATSLGLPHNSIEAVEAARDKHATRRISEAAGLPTPKHASIESAADLESAATTVGFPAVIKPIGMFQSMGVLRVNSLPELVSAYDQVLGELSRAQAAAQGTDDYRSTVAGLGARMVLEEFLDGDEQVVDVVFQEGQCVYASVTDNWPATRSFEAAQGKFNETGSSSPSLLSQDQQTELIDLGVATTRALGFRLGVFCLNMKYTSRGARLIEVNSRMGGMFVRDHNWLCWGVDLVEEHLLASLGLYAPPLKAATPLRASAGIYVSAEKSGVVSDANVLGQYVAAAKEKGESSGKMPGDDKVEFAYFHAMVTEGDTVLGPHEASDFPTWLCGFMLHAPTVRGAIERAQAVNDEVVSRVAVRSAE